MKIHVIQAENIFDEIRYNTPSPKAALTYDELIEQHAKPQVTSPSASLQPQLRQRQKEKVQEKPTVTAPSAVVQKSVHDLEPIAGKPGWGKTKSALLIASLAKQSNIPPLQEPDLVQHILGQGVAYLVTRGSDAAAIFIVHGNRKVQGIWFANKSIGTTTERDAIRNFIRLNKLDASEVKCWCNCADPSGCKKIRVASANVGLSRSSAGNFKYLPTVHKVQPKALPKIIEVNTPTEHVKSHPEHIATPMKAVVSDVPAGWKKVINIAELYGVIAKFGMDRNLPSLVAKEDEVWVDDYLGIVAILNPASGEMKSVSYPDDTQQNPAKVVPQEKEKAQARIRQVQKLAARKNIRKYRRVCFCNDSLCGVGPFHKVEIK